MVLTNRLKQCDCCEKTTSVIQHHPLSITSLLSG